MRFKNILLSPAHGGLVRTICNYNGYILTGSADCSVNVWSAEGEFLCKISGFSDWVNTITGWDDILVCGSYDYSIKFWKLTQTQTKLTSANFECILSFAAHNSYVLASIIWNGELITGSADCSLKIWNKEGKLIHSELNAHNSGIRFMIVFHNYLWTASNDGNIRQWEKDSSSSLSCKATFKGHTGNVNSICSWKDDRIASGSHDTTVKVWDLEGNCLNTFNLEGRITWAVVEWMGKLVAGASFDSVIHTNNGAALYIWDWDGTLNQVIPAEHTSSLFVFQNKLWQGCDRSVVLWKEAREWNIERVLWIGWKKNQPGDCLLASLPKEMLRLVINFLYE